MLFRRLLAFLIDVLPITALCAGYFWFFEGFDVTFAEFVKSPRDPKVRAHYFEQRTEIRTLSSLLCIIYFVIFESSGARNTVGKAIAGIRVVRRDGSPLSFGCSLKRNLSKFVAILPGGLGLLYPLFNRERLFFHDHIAGTVVRRTEVDDCSY